MVFPKLPDVADVQAQTLPFIMMPYLIWAFMGDMWAAALELSVAPFTSEES